MTTSTWRTAALLPAVLLPAALLLSACGSVVAGGSGSDLPVLHIGARQAALGDAGNAVGGSGAPDDPYPLVGTLPTGPASAPVHRYGTSPVPDAAVTALAASLGLSGSAERRAHGVVIESRSGALRVRDGGAWSYARTDEPCAGVTVDVDAADPWGTTVSCGVGPGEPSRAPVGDPRATAAPVLAAAGAGGLPARVDTAVGSATVTVEPKVGGAVTSGIATSVAVDADGVTSAYGVLGAPAEGPVYPLISAARALEVLRAMPRPELAIACTVGEICPGFGPQKVTGAALGLVAAYDGGEQVLVPAWFFTVAGSTVPVTLVAVADRYLADPDPVGGSGSGGGSVGGSSGSAIPPGEPATPQPAPTASDLPLPIGEPTAYRVESYSVSTDGRTLTLRTQGGVCTDYAGAADEAADVVKATITGTPNQESGQVCPAIAKAIEVQVALRTALGDRRVVDPEGAPVPLRP